MSPARIEQARARLVAIARDPTCDIAEGALWLAAEDYPELAVDAYLERIDQFADLVGNALAGDQAWEVGAQHSAMVSCLFAEDALRGDSGNYDDPRNSFLNEVLDRQLGMPITLAIVYLAVGRRLGFPVHGVNAPGHFLVRHGDLLVDPFSRGETITPEVQYERLKRVGVPDPAATLAELLARPPDNHVILCRVLMNLKASSLRRGDHRRALGAVDRLVALKPDDLRELRDRGALLQRLDCPAAAIRDLESYLERVTNDPDEEKIRDLITRMRASSASLH